MVLNTTYYNKEHKQMLNDFVGTRFSFFESLKMGGTGSKRMIIEEVSPNLRLLMNTVSDINYANIELRKKDIIVHVNKGLKNFAWAIPYYQLVIYKTNGASIHAQGKFIHFLNNKTFRENKRFFNKLLIEKIKYDQQYNFQNI